MLADRVVLLNRGAIEQQGEPMELYARPANRFVASFLGSPPINYIHGRLHAANGVTELRLPDGSSFTLPASRRARIASGGERDITLGVRPEHFLVSSRAGSQAIRSQVTLVQPAGARVFVNFPIAGASVMGEFSAREHFAPGEELVVELDMDRIVMLDPVTGRAIEE